VKKNLIVQPTRIIVLHLALALALLATGDVSAQTTKKHSSAPATKAPAEAKPPAGGESAKVVSAFLDSWFKGDLDETMSYLAEDVYYWNVPAEPIRGRVKSRQFLAPFFEKDPLVVPSSFETKVKQTLADGANVIVERVDSFDINGKKWKIPVVGVFEVKNGKITVWKDYFDMAQFQPVATLIEVLAKKK